MEQIDQNSEAVVETESFVREVTLDLIDLGTLKARIKKLNRRALRLGLPEITFVETARVERRHVGYGLEVSIKVPTVTVVISGRTPKLPGGWKFIGSIEHLGDAGNLIHGDDERLATWRNAEPLCGHCNKIRSRKKTAILENSDSELIQVGSTCIKDFLGYHSDPEAILKYEADFYSLDDDFGDSRGSGDGPRETLRVLTLAAASIRANGWAAKSSGGEVPTSYVVEIACGLTSMPRLTNRDEEPPALVHFKRVNVTDRDVQRAEEVLEWVRSIPENESNNYLANLRVVGSQDLVIARHLGTLVSAESAMIREREAAVAREAADADKCRIPQTGRITVSGEIVRMKYVDSPYGEIHKMLVKVTTNEGEYKLWGSVPRSLEGDYVSDANHGQILMGAAEQGDKITFTATVERSRDDDSFGFFKRPSKASLVRELARGEVA